MEIEEQSINLEKLFDLLDKQRYLTLNDVIGFRQLVDSLPLDDMEYYFSKIHQLEYLENKYEISLCIVRFVRKMLEKDMRSRKITLNC
jgi:hypothetical protein